MRFVFTILAALASLSFFTDLALGEQCGLQHDPKQNSDDMDTVYYVCSGSNSQQLKVRFYRLDEALSASIVTHTPIPEFEEYLGPFKVVDNDVSAEAKNLFLQFGTWEDFDFSIDDLTWSLASRNQELTAKKEKDSDDTNSSKDVTPAPVKQLRRISYLSSSRFDLDSSNIILKSAGNTIARTTHWPPDFKFWYYSECSLSFITCTTVWRYISASDFDFILRDMREFVSSIDKDLLESDPSRTRIVPDFEKNFSLYRYLAQKGGMPSTFLSIETGLVGGCTGDLWSFTYSARPLTVDVAVIENLTDQSIKLDSFLGSPGSTTALRSAEQSTAPPGNNLAALNIPSQTVPPKSKLMVPLRVRFGFLDKQKPSFEDAKKTYETIKSSRQSVFRYTSDSGYSITKTKKSFERPEPRDTSDYLFGPEATLRGLSADGIEFVFQTAREGGATINPIGAGDLSFHIFLGSRGESCPILLAWDEQSGRWIILGKVLDQAQGSKNEMTETIRLPRVQTRFHLEERELETSHIKSVVLKLELSDGRILEVKPKQSFERTIPSFTSVGIDFDLPAGLSAKNIVSSELAITGYYDRYGSLPALVNR